jgi:hypothetical protein
MNEKKVKASIAMMTASAILVLVGLGSAYGASAPESKTQYPSMAPLHLYLDDRDTEIAMARSAAPDAISRDATVMVLTEHGYVTAVEGKNGFVCIVERAWMSPEDSPSFWNPKMRGPLCFNPPAVRSILPATFERTKLAIAGKSKSEIIAANKEVASAGAGLNELHDVKARIPDRRRRQPRPRDDLHAPYGSRGVGRRCAQLAGYAEPAVQRCRANRCVGDFGWQVVGWNAGAGNVGSD